MVNQTKIPIFFGISWRFDHFFPIFHGQKKPRNRVATVSPGGIPRDLLPRHHGCRGSPRPTGSQRGGETEVDRFVTWESSGIVGKLGKI